MTESKFIVVNANLRSQQLVKFIYIFEGNG